MTTLIPKYDEGSTGSINRPFNEKLQEFISPQDFGAVSYTGTYSGQADASTAIQNAINACPDGGTVYLDGKYYVANPITISSSNIVIKGGTIEVAQAYTGAIFILKPATGLNITGTSIQDVRMQTTGRNSVTPADWFGQFIGIQFKCAERAIFGCAFNNIVIEYPNKGFYWNEVTASPSSTANFTTSCSFEGIKIFGALTNIQTYNASGSYSGQVFGNIFADCTFSLRENASTTGVLVTDSYTEWQLGNCTFFADTTTRYPLFPNLTGNSKLSITGGYYEIDNGQLASSKNISFTNIRTVAPNVGAHNLKPADLSSSDNRSNLICADFNSFNTSASTGAWWQTGAGATIAVAGGLFYGYPAYTYTQGANSGGYLGYTVPNAVNYSFGCPMVLSVYLQSSAQYAIVVTVSYTTGADDVFTSYLSPDVVIAYPQRLSVSFRTDQTRIISSFGFYLQGAVGTVANIANPVLSVGTSTPFYGASIPKSNVFATSIPTSGIYNQGDIVYNSTPTSGGYIGWVCTVAGTPGTWKTFGAITA